MNNKRKWPSKGGEDFSEEYDEEDLEDEALVEKLEVLLRQLLSECTKLRESLLLVQQTQQTHGL